MCDVTRWWWLLHHHIESWHCGNIASSCIFTQLLSAAVCVSYRIVSYRSLFIAVDFIYWLSICSCIMYIYLGISSYLSFHLNMFSLHEHAKIVSQHLCYLRKFIGFAHCFDDDTVLADAFTSQVSISCSQTALNTYATTSTKIYIIIFTCIFLCLWFKFSFFVGCLVKKVGHCSNHLATVCSTDWIWVLMQ